MAAHAMRARVPALSGKYKTNVTRRCQLLPNGACCIVVCVSDGETRSCRKCSRSRYSVLRVNMTSRRGECVELGVIREKALAFARDLPPGNFADLCTVSSATRMQAPPPGVMLIASARRGAATSRNGGGPSGTRDRFRQGVDLGRQRGAGLDCTGSCRVGRG